MSKHDVCMCVGLTRARVVWCAAGVYKIRQALMAQAVGADYVAPYVGRIADGICAKYQQDPEDWQQYQQEYQAAAMESAIDAVAAMQAAVEATGSSMRVLVASIRSAADMGSLAARVSMGCCNWRVQCMCAGHHGVQLG